MLINKIKLIQLLLRAFLLGQLLFISACVPTSPPQTKDVQQALMHELQLQINSLLHNKTLSPTTLAWLSKLPYRIEVIQLDECQMIDQNQHNYWQCHVKANIQIGIKNQFYDETQLFVFRNHHWRLVQINGFMPLLEDDDTIE